MSDLTDKARKWQTLPGVLSVNTEDLVAEMLAEIERLTNALAEEQEANSIAYTAIERLTNELQYARNLLGNASGALADYTDLPTDTKPADAIRILADKVWEEQP